MRVERLKREYDIRVEYVNFPLHPETPPEGISLLEMFGGERARPRLRQSQERLKQRAAEARKVLRDRLYKGSVDLDWASSRPAGITGVPTFEAGGRRVVGAQPYEELARLVAAAGAGRSGGPGRPRFPGSTGTSTSPPTAGHEAITAGLPDPCAC